MELQITGHNVEITDALRETVTAKCKKLEQFFDKINSVQVILRIEKVSKIAEATAQVNGADLHASAEKRICTRQLMRWQKNSAVSCPNTKKN